MPHLLRFAPPDPQGRVLTQITIRCIQGRYLLRPSPRLNSLMIGVMAKAQEAYPLLVHDFTFMSNHAHFLVSGKSQKEISSFMNFLNSNAAREVTREHKWDGKIWARRYSSTPIVGGEEIQVARLKYGLSQGTKEGLVDSPWRWPGANAAKAIANGMDLEGIWVDRTAICKARRRLPPEQVRIIDFEEKVTLRLSPLPCWAHLSPAEYQARIRELIQEIETEARENRQGKPIAGRSSVLRKHPHFRPKKLVTSPAPFVHAPTRQIRLAFLEAYRIFVRAFRAAAERLKEGDLGVRFPVGSFPPGLPFVEEKPQLKPG